MTITPTKKGIYFAGFKLLFTHYMEFKGHYCRRFDKDWEEYATKNGLGIEHGVWGDQYKALKDKTNKQVFYRGMASALNFVNDPEHKKNMAKWNSEYDSKDLLIDIGANYSWEYDSL